MVTDQQVRKLMKLKQTEKTLSIAAAKSGMDEKTARKYLRANKLPSELRTDHLWCTREDAFADVWSGVVDKLETNSGLEAKTLFDDLQRRYRGRFADGQLRTLQRRVKVWRATQGSAREVFFAQKHYPGKLGQSDFTRMGKLNITIHGVPFDHMVYHFVLTYSNWETGTICFSESLESLSTGLQNALWELGGAPETHQTDQLTAAVNNLSSQKEFTARYKALMSHYNLESRKSQAGKGNENGDVEQRHYRFKKAVGQALMLRGSRDFASRGEYAKFLRHLFDQLNSGRKKRFAEELEVLHRLPDKRLDACKRLEVRVGPGSTIRVNSNVYSVHSRLIGEKVSVKLHADHLEIWYGQRCVDSMGRLRGKSKHAINYRHIIDWLVRKPGAFENYRYRDAMFPTSRFRIAYDSLKQRHNFKRANKEYLRILHLAAHVNEAAVDQALAYLIQSEIEITFDTIKSIVQSGQDPKPPQAVAIAIVELSNYDDLLNESEVA